MPSRTINPDHKYLKYWRKIEESSIFKYITVNFTYWKTKGLLNIKKEKIMVTAFLHVVTVAATGAPHVVTKVKTAWIPK